MADELEPPRKFYELKPKEFERLNARASAAPDPSPTGAAPQAVGPIDVRELARQASEGTPLLGGINAPANRPNDVHGLLAGNLARANEAGLNHVAPVRKRTGRRRRDYLTVLIPVNAFFAFWAFGPWANPVTFVYGIGGIALFTASLSWVMFGVMEDY